MMKHTTEYAVLDLFIITVPAYEKMEISRYLILNMMSTGHLLKYSGQVDSISRLTGSKAFLPSF